MKVDSRAGSREFITPLTAAGVPIETVWLEAGDMEIIGRGLGGVPTLVGVEVKKWPDLLQCLRDGRFADQQRKMKEMYEVRWLVTYGDRDRAIAGPGKHTDQEVDAWLMTQVMAGGTLYWSSPSLSSAVSWLRTLHLWWTAKNFEEHRSHLDWYKTPAGNYLEEPSATQEMAVVLPNIGTMKSALVAEAFPTPAEMVNADWSRWMAIEGISLTTWERIDAYLRRGVKPRRKALKHGNKGR